MQDFVARENVRHFRRKFAEAQTDSERVRIAALLDEARKELDRLTDFSEDE
jgi:hypothetical protein